MESLRQIQTPRSKLVIHPYETYHPNHFRVAKDCDNSSFIIQVVSLCTTTTFELGGLSLTGGFYVF